LRVVHVCLSCFYVDGFAYQENELVRQNVKDGHEVTVIASTESFGEDRHLTYVEPSTYLGRDGAQVVRLPYRSFLPHKLMRKLRMHSNVLKLLQRIRPEVILFHDLCGWELHAVARYKRENPSVRLFVDSHEDVYNSARGFVSKHILHGLYYRWIITRCRRHFEKVLCVSLETMDFVRQMYGVPVEQLEFYPLGGRVFEDNEYLVRRELGRRDAGVEPDQVLLVQTGKMGTRKKLLETLQAFIDEPSGSLRLVIAGSLDEDLRSKAEAIIASDSRISFLGWRTSDDLVNLLCAADMYVQPGTQSATMQMALCARCPVILDNVPSHAPYVDGNGWMLRGTSDLRRAFSQIAADPKMLDNMAIRSLTIARKLLDYSMLANRLLG
jgi:1,2-diacylglycerol 3-alpha-glucosyltransferase